MEEKMFCKVEETCVDFRYKGTDGKIYEHSQTIVHEFMYRSVAENLLHKKWRELTEQEQKVLLHKAHLYEETDIIDFDDTPLSISGERIEGEDENGFKPLENAEIYCAATLDEWYKDYKFADDTN